LRRRDLFIWVEEKQAEPVKELVDRVKQAISASLAQSSSCTHLSTKSLYKQFDHSRAGYFRSMGINSD
jgi:ribosomal protein S6